METATWQRWVRGAALSIVFMGSAAAAVACSSSSTGQIFYTMTGTWAGLGQVDSIGMTLTQSGSQVTGTGAVNGTATNVTGTVSGTSVSLTFFLGNASSLYTGAFSDPNQVVGSFGLSGGGTEAITFNRQ